MVSDAGHAEYAVDTMIYEPNVYNDELCSGQNLPSRINALDTLLGGDIHDMTLFDVRVFRVIGDCHVACTAVYAHCGDSSVSCARARSLWNSWQL